MEVSELYRVRAIFELPIIQAPKRNSKLDKEMCPKAPFSKEPLLCALRVRHASTRDGRSIIPADVFGRGC